MPTLPSGTVDKCTSSACYADTGELIPRRRVANIAPEKIDLNFWTGCRADAMLGQEVKSMQGISHVAVGVSDMDRSLHFYRDLLGLQVTLDTLEDVGGLPTVFHDPQPGQRRAVYLRWEGGPQASFIVLSAPAGPTAGEAIKLDQVGIHHFAFWVTDLRARVEKLQQAGVRILVPPIVADTVAYGEPPGGKVLTCLFQDPDGIIVQFDERVA